MEIPIKICIECNKPKLINEFHRAKNGWMGVQAICKVCISNYGKIYYIANKKRIRACRKIRYKANTKRLIDDQKIYAKANSKKIKSYKKTYRKTNKETLNAYLRAYRKNNKEKMNARERIYLRIKYKTDFKFQLNQKISGAIRKTLKGNKNGYHWEALVGYTLDDLKKHLEKLFTTGMTWDKYLNSEIHIDHKIPKSAFNFTKPEHRDFKRCWALSNLQPMWALENIIKSNKLLKHFQPSLLI